MFIFFFFLFFLGFGKCLSYTCCMIVVGQYFDKRRGLAVGLATAGVGIGMFVFPPLLEWLFQTYAFFGSMVLMAGISLNLCVCSMLYRPLEENLRSPPRFAYQFFTCLTTLESENVPPPFLVFDSCLKAHPLLDIGSSLLEEALSPSL